MFGKITKNYIYNLIYQLFVLFVPLVTAPYLARVLGATGTGVFSYVASMTSIICTVIMLGIFNYGSRQVAYVREDKDKLSDTFWQIFSARLVIALIGTIVYFVITVALGRYVDLFMIYYTYMLSYFVDCTWVYIGVEDMKWAVIKNIITKLLAVSGIFLLIKGEDDVPVYVAIQGLSMLISNLLAYSQLGRYINKQRLDFSNIKQDIKGAAILFLPSIAVTIYTQCDKVMIELITGLTEEVSFYDYSEKIVTIPLTFIIVLSTVMMPRIANEYKKGNTDTISKLINSTAKFSLFIALPMVLGLIAVADKLVPWYLGIEFMPTVQAIVLISPIIITNSLTGVSGGQYFTATNQMKVLIISQFLAAITNIIVNLLLIPKYGFYGAATATLITSIGCALFQYIYLLRQIKLTGLMKECVKYLLASCIMFFTIKIFTRNMLASPVTNIVQVMIGIFSYFLCSVFFRVEVVTLLYSRIKK